MLLSLRACSACQKVSRHPGWRLERVEWRMVVYRLVAQPSTPPLEGPQHSIDLLLIRSAQARKATHLEGTGGAQCWGLQLCPPPAGTLASLQRQVEELVNALRHGDLSTVLIMAVGRQLCLTAPLSLEKMAA